MSRPLVVTIVPISQYYGIDSYKLDPCSVRAYWTDKTLIFSGNGHTLIAILVLLSVRLDDGAFYHIKSSASPHDLRYHIIRNGRWQASRSRSRSI